MSRQVVIFSCLLVLLPRVTHGASYRQGMDINWCTPSENGLPKPDALFFLSLPMEVAASRGEYGEVCDTVMRQSCT